MAMTLAQLRTRFGAAMATAPPGLGAADQLCAACVDFLGVDGAAISMVFDGTSHGTYGSSSNASRRLDEYQFTFGEGPCLDAAASGQAVLVPDLDSPSEHRWPVFTGAVLGEGIRAVFALPVMITSTCVGALDLFCTGPGPLHDDQLAGGLLAAELASLPLLDLLTATTQNRGTGATDDTMGEGSGQDAWARLAELDRIEVYQATGMLIAQLDVDAAEALLRLRAHAMATGQTASEVAWAIVERRLELDRDQRSGQEGTR